MDVPKYIHYDFVSDVNVDIIKSGPKLTQRTEIYALLPDLAWDKTVSAKIINKKTLERRYPYYVCDLTRYGAYLVGLGVV